MGNPESVAVLGLHKSLDHRILRRVLGVPVAVASIVETERQVFAGVSDISEPYAITRGTPPAHLLCEHVVREGPPLIICDASTDARRRPEAGVRRRLAHDPSRPARARRERHVPPSRAGTPPRAQADRAGQALGRRRAAKPPANQLQRGACSRLSPTRGPARTPATPTGHSWWTRPAPSVGPTTSPSPARAPTADVRHKRSRPGTAPCE